MNLNRHQPKRSLLETFLSLAQMTTPAGYECYCWPFLPYPNSKRGRCIDLSGNVHICIKNSKNEMSRVMWSCHLDTADNTPVFVKFRRTSKNLIKTDGKSVLGADCKIGAAIMIKMIEAGIPGWYVFHVKEEIGRQGSIAAARRIEKIPDKPVICIAFDRYGVDHVITHQSGMRTCSDEFGNSLAEILNRKGLKYGIRANGLYTDSKSYADFTPECTNISVGYNNHHTNSEYQDMSHADALLDVILANPDAFEYLPAVRDPKEIIVRAPYKYYQSKHHENKHWTDEYYGGSNDDWDENGKLKPAPNRTLKDWFQYRDQWFHEKQVGVAPPACKSKNSKKKWRKMRLKVMYKERKIYNQAEKKVVKEQTALVLRTVSPLARPLPPALASEEPPPPFEPELTDEQEKELIMDHALDLWEKGEYGERNQWQWVFMCTDCNTIQRVPALWCEEGEVVPCQTCGDALEGFKVRLVGDTPCLG